MAAGETLAFVRSHLEEPGARILEVGCGDGLLVKMLVDEGADARGIDVAETTDEGHRVLGERVQRVDVLEYQAEPFDAVLFSRSLHHIHPTSAAVERAAQLLTPGGVLLVEDFAAERVDVRAAAWRYALPEVLDAAGVLTVRPTPRGEDPLGRWRKEHAGDEVAGSRLMREALNGHFRVDGEASVPYLYRYLVDEIEATPAGEAVTEALLAWESELIDADELPAIGLRWTARLA